MIIKRIPLILLGASFIKCLISPGWVDLGCLVIVAGLTAFFEYKEDDKKIKALTEELNKTKAEVSEQLAEHTKFINELRSGITGIKLGQQRIAR